MGLRFRFSFAVAAVAVVLGVLPAFAATVIVDVANFAFSPKNVTITEGDIVRWEWVSGAHTTTSGTNCTSNGLWNASINSSSQSFQRQFNGAGTFPYYCAPHCGSGMTGTITVEAFSGVLEGDAATSIPGSFSLQQNFPNPFNSSTLIRYTLERDSDVHLQVFDILGRSVTTLVDGPQPLGVYEAAWDGTSDHGESVSSGIYFYRLTIRGEVISRKMTLLK